MFFGLAALIIAGFVHYGIISGWVSSITIWMFLSLFMVLTLRQLAAKWLPADSEVKHTDDDIDAIGTKVTVTKQVDVDHNKGRVRYQGTEWPARSMERKIEVGEQAYIRLRENITWIIEASEAKTK